MTSFWINVLLFVSTSSSSWATTIEYPTAVRIKDNFNLTLHAKYPQITYGWLTFKGILWKNNIYVDKTMLIRKLLTDDHQGHKIVLITGPRKFCKTINLYMMKEFLKHEVDWDAIRIPINETYGYKLFRNLSYETSWVHNTWELIKHPLLVTEDTQFVDQHQGQYPTIFITFDNITGDNFIEIYNYMLYEMHHAFREHIYIINHLSYLLRDEKNQTKFEEIYNTFTYYLAIENEGGAEDEIASAFLFLSELLYKYYNKKMYIFVSDYDYILRKVLFEITTIPYNDKERILNWFETFYEFTLVGNPYVEKVFLTGVFSFPTRRMRLLIRDVYEYDFYRDLSQYYGFTEQEVDSFCQHFNIGEKLKNELRLRYNGYKGGENYTRNVYNPWSMIRFLNQADRKVKPFWPKETKIEIVARFARNEKVNETLQSLIRGETVFLRRERLHFTRQDFENLKYKIIYKHEFVDDDIQIILGYLYRTGYLTPCENVDNSDVQVAVRMPNRETKNGLEGRLQG
ncbi:uncharacterized protein LOC135834714 [Planococcus citri]|uniref:uncharacterized protein LOC135834714 n=1 Tax=Planococcus citri TaxID=170843 RepID=UPI0031F78AC6